jgi:hypothetical protein
MSDLSQQSGAKRTWSLSPIATTPLSWAWAQQFTRRQDALRLLGLGQGDGHVLDRKRQTRRRPIDCTTATSTSGCSRA